MNKLTIVTRYEYMGSDVVDGPCSNVERVHLVRDSNGMLRAVTESRRAAELHLAYWQGVADAR